MKQRLTELPNYTCLETIERSSRASLAAEFKTGDTIRIEVAEVDGKEMFALPGQPFEKADPSAFVKGGTMASGFFASFSTALFIKESATSTFARDEEVNGRKFSRYDFQVSYLSSGYTISSLNQSVVVAYHGSFWAEGETLDVVHLRNAADAIPPALGLRDAEFEIEYQKVRIGRSEALLPRRVGLLVTEFSGVQRRNITTFSHCHQYASQSVLTFDEPARK